MHNLEARSVHCRNDIELFFFLNCRRQEFHLSQTYHEGLLKLQAKDYEKARELLESILKDPIIANSKVIFFFKNLFDFSLLIV